MEARRNAANDNYGSFAPFGPRAGHFRLSLYSGRAILPLALLKSTCAHRTTYPRCPRPMGFPRHSRQPDGLMLVSADALEVLWGSCVWPDGRNEKALFHA